MTFPQEPGQYHGALGYGPAHQPSNVSCRCGKPCPVVSPTPATGGPCRRYAVRTEGSCPAPLSTFVAGARRGAMKANVASRCAPSSRVSSTVARLVSVCASVFLIMKVALTRQSGLLPPAQNGLVARSSLEVISRMAPDGSDAPGVTEAAASGETGPAGNCLWDPGREPGVVVPHATRARPASNWSRQP